jgi:bile acid:Na+ symporter, BASS family
MSTRNLGAAFAPLFAIADVDQRAIVMVALGVPMQTIFSLLAARWFARRAPIGDPGVAPAAE